MIGWGFKPNALFTEVDTEGQVMLDVALAKTDQAYRVIKVAPNALNHALLRSTAGLPPITTVQGPTVSFVAPVQIRPS